MTIEDMATAIGRVHGAALDEVTRALWAGVAAGKIGDGDAARLSEAIQARRMVGQANRTLCRTHAKGVCSDLSTPPKPQRPPERSVAIERRRRLAASGPMPPALAARFTTGELAVLRIVADEFQARQVCALCLDAVAARAGVSRTLAKNAIRQARRLGMIDVRERRRTGAKSLPNLVTVIDREWLAWIKRGHRRTSALVAGGVSRSGETGAHPRSGSSGIGGRNLPTTDTRGFRGEKKVVVARHRSAD